MKKRYIVIIVFLSSSIFLYNGMIKKQNMDAGMLNVAVNKTNSYDSSSEIKKALSAVDVNKKADLIKNINSEDDIIFLSFEGLSDKDTMDKVADLLEEHGIKATFFVPGIKAAEDPSIIKRLKNGGNDIGNGTLGINKSMEKMSVKDLVTDFCRTSNILRSIIGKSPDILKCNSTIYNDSILSAAFATGNKQVVESNHYISYQSFKNFEQVYDYTNGLRKGTIVSIKLDGVLDSREYEKKAVEEKSAVDKKAGLEESKLKKEQEVKIVQIVEWFIKAVEEQKKSVVKLSEFSSVKLSDKTQIAYNIPHNAHTLKDKKAVNMVLQNNKLVVAENNKVSNEVKNELEKNLDSINFKELIEKNDKKEAAVISRIFTTQKALSYTFRGLSNEASLDNVLKALDKVNAKGTFFVTKAEIIKYPDRINKILSRGHEIGNGGITNSTIIINKSTEEICKEIYEVDRLLKERGIKTNAYMAGYGYTSPQIREAVSSITNIPELKDYELFTYTKAPIIEKYKNMDADRIVDSYFNITSYLSLGKGEIIYLRLDTDLFKADDTVANIIQLVTKNFVENGYAYKYNEKLKHYDLVQKPLGYSIVTLGNIQNTYETSSQFGRYNLLSNISPLKKINQTNALKMMKTNYIGNIYIDLTDFSDEEKNYLDTSGTIETQGETVVFFTFDDWGGDPTVNEILDVLNKHNVKASFFAIAKNADVNNGLSNINPNLLRTIALNGHDIGSHNYNHELLGTDSAILEESLIKSYNAMDRVIGDLDSLRPYFRPPTLSLTKEGLESVYESGYKYCVNGNITTHDYERGSAQDIVNYIEKGIVKNKGNVIIMHMMDKSYYTAEALDTFLTNNEKGLYGSKYKIAKLSDYLGK